MAYSTQNLFSNSNLAITNSIILNNYSIQNLIFTPSNIDNYGTFQISSNNYYQQNNQRSFSPTPKKASMINIIPNGLERTKKNLFKNTTPLSSYKSTNKLKCINIKRIPIDSKNKNIITKIIPISKGIKHIEKHPKDSVSKKSKKKGKKIIERNNNRKIIKISKSSNVIKTINQFEFDRYRIKTDVSFPKNSKPKKKKIPCNNYKTLILETKIKLNLKEFIFGEQIGNGTFGKIFSVKWVINNKNYAMKKEIVTDYEDVEKRRNTCKIIQNFRTKTKCRGVIRLYGNLCFKNIKQKNNINDNGINLINETHFIYYELMEKAQRDWDKEINIRRTHKLYYTENELLNIMTQLIATLSLLEKNHITHRDIKPQNILVLNGEYKLGDFGEIRVLKREGLIVQRVRGSELYMSPILFHGLHLNLIQVKHNTYKSDVFSLGMCLFYAASLTYCGVDSIRELTDMKKIKDILFQFLSIRYSDELIMFILSMLEIDENKRMNFIQLENKLTEKLLNMR